MVFQRLSFTFCSSVAIVLLALAFQAKATSAYRDPARSYQEYLTRQPLFQTQGWRSSAEAVSQVHTEASLLQALDQAQMTENKNFEATEIFKKVRDLRFLQNRVDPSFLRRISWLYPDDGCFARAEIGIKKFNEFGITGLKKIFVFGDLQVETNNARNGFVTWWFHVVPVMKMGSEYYAIDPAIDPLRPLTVLEWIYKMSPSLKDVRISICEAATYDPGTSCSSPVPMADEEVLAHQRTYLGSEWYRMKELGRNPIDVLGDNPPWLDEQTPTLRQNLN